MTKDEAIGLALGKLSKPGNVRDSKATYEGDASGEWTVVFRMSDGSRLHYRVQSDGTASLDRILAELTPSFDSGNGGRFLLGLIFHVCTLLIIVFFVIKLISKVRG